MKKLTILILILLGAIPSFSQAQKLNIYLVRHAKVAIDKPAFIGSMAASELLATYNTNPIENFNPEMVRDHIKADHPTIIASALPRAMQTACTVFPDDSITGYALFNEYQMGIVRIPLLHMPYSAWTGLSRILWLINVNSTKESRPESKKRLSAATDLLENIASKKNEVVLFSHGYLISEMRRELQKRGWHMVKNGGNRNLAVSHFEKTLVKE